MEGSKSVSSRSIKREFFINEKVVGVIWISLKGYIF